MIRIWEWIRSLFFPPPPPPPLKRVGWLCSVTNNNREMDAFLDAFKQGLDGGTGTIPVREKYAQGSYGPGNRNDPLVAHAKRFMTPGPDKVEVVVATGGIVSLQAAVQAANDPSTVAVPILFIVGRDLGNATVTHPNISGGIFLDVPRHNQQRVNELRQPPYNATRIGLLVNHNAAMGPDEDAGWDRAWGPVEACGRTEQNVNINLQQAINNLITAGATGIVVSGDPYFASKRSPLVAQLNTKNVPVCYPFDMYLPTATRGRSMRFGPVLEDCYTQLGDKARQVLASSAAIPDVGRTTAQNTARHWA